MNTKSELRKRFLAERRALPPEEVERRSRAISELVYNESEHRAVLPRWIDTPTEVATEFGLSAQPSTTQLYTVSFFLPIARQNEVDTWPIIHRVWAELPNIQLAAPVTDPVGRTLTHYPLTPQTKLINNRWGIPEPVGSGQSAVGSEQFNAVFVPLLAFDLYGQRVGYGGGYYDRFLALCRPNCVKIGLSLFEPVPQINDVEPTDVRLDGCVTPTKVYWF